MPNSTPQPLRPALRCIRQEVATPDSVLNYPRSLHRVTRLLAVAFWAASTLGAFASTVLWQETFNNTSGTSTSVSSIGWNAYQGSTATVISTSNNAAVISSATGNPTSDGNGYFGFIGTATYPAHVGTVAVTKTFSSSIDIANSTITWTMANSSTAVTAQLLIQVNNSWYISNTTFSNTQAYTSISTASTASILQTLNFSTAAADWSAFTLSPYVSMTVGTTLGADLSSSSITGIGFYLSNATDLVARLDTLTVTVPEPSTAALALCGTGLWLCLFRRGGCRIS